MRIVFLVFLMMVPPLSAFAGTDASREVVEATALLRDVMTDAPHHRCDFDSDWNSYPVPSALAQKHLGLTLFVDILASPKLVSVQSVADPSNKSTTSFCSQKDYSNFLNEHDHSDDNDPLKRTSISFPVFDKNFETAIVVFVFTEEGGYGTALKNHKQVKLIPQFSAVAFIYKRSGNRWKSIDSEVLAVT